MSNNQIEQIKQFLHNEICERRDYSASKMCEEVLKFIAYLSEEKNDRAGMNGIMTMNNNPGNDVTTDNPLNMTVLREYITMYLDDVETYGDETELNEATNVLYDFVLYVNSMRGLVEGETNDEQEMIEYDQSIIEYNAMEEEWDMDNYNEMQ